MLIGALFATIALFAGCAASQEAHAPRMAGGWAVKPLDQDSGSLLLDAHSPAIASSTGAWVASSSGSFVTDALEARRNSTLVGRPPATLVDTSVWPGERVPREVRRITPIYSRWGTRY